MQFQCYIKKVISHFSNIGNIALIPKLAVPPYNVYSDRECEKTNKQKGYFVYGYDNNCVNNSPRIVEENLYIRTENKVFVDFF